MLSDRRIKQALAAGELTISPFQPHRLNACSYDLSVGDTIARYNRNVTYVDLAAGKPDLYRTPEKVSEIVLAPGERILGHSVEEFGGGPTINCTIYATSTAARIGISVCGDAGFGDPNYRQVWTLEITNNSPCTISIPVGSIIAQAVFWDVGECDTLYGVQQGNYATKAWRPENMLPNALKRR
jgi:dCTP deaminase